MAYKNTLPCSARTFYRLVHAGLLESVCTIDLPFAVRYRPRKQEKPPRRSNISKESLRGRTYEDFLLLDADEKMHATEMDCVCGKSTDSSILLTIFWRVWKFQLVVLLASHTSEEVIRQLDLLERSLIGSFPAVMLVDRGHEFCNAKMIERAKHEYYEDGCRCSLFYCDPMRSDQRALSENNHRLIRRIIPKGTSLDDLSQEQVSLMCSHINSMPRASLDGKSPMSLAMEKLPEQFFFDYGLKLITPDKIILRPDLLDSI
jgi:IS30 family transposase